MGLSYMASARPPVHIPNESLTFPLRKAAESFPEKIAVIEPEAGGREWTYAELEERSSGLAASLNSLGVEAGDRVGVWLKNSVEYILSFYGILKAGAVVVPVSTHHGEREVTAQLAVTKAKAIIAAQDQYRQVCSLEGKAAIRIAVTENGAVPAGPGLTSFSSLIDGRKLFDRSIDCDPRETLAVLPFSSGTTGLPKGVMLTHANLVANLHQVQQAHKIGPEDIMLNQLPFFHIYGMTVLMGSAILAGARQVLASRFRPVEEFLGLFTRYRPTLFLTVPLILKEFCQSPLVPKMDWSSMRHFNSGGAPLSPEIQERLAGLTGVPVTQGYGLTESSPTTHVVPLDAIKTGRIGTPLSLTEHKIVDPVTQSVVPVGEVGELWVRGPQVMKGYYNDPKASSNTLVDGWLLTGDLAKQDEDGYVCIVDRLKELIKCKGFQVAPAEIEHVLHGHPGILDAAVIGEPHPVFGEVPVAYVVVQKGSGLSGEAVIEYAAQGMAKYKRLAKVVLIDAIPRSPSGKILRRVLKDAHRPVGSEW
ncbi:MAG: class I adenylate-forming enzyme family protein [Syntrophobacteraceae bacterium]